MVERGSGGASRRHPSVYPFHSSTYPLIFYPDLFKPIYHLHLVMDCGCAYLILWFSELNNTQFTLGTLDGRVSVPASKGTALDVGNGSGENRVRCQASLFGLPFPPGY